MTLKKTLASYRKMVPVKVEAPDGSMLDGFQEVWVDQQDIDMHPLEENSVRAHWAIHDQMSRVPQKPTKDIEHDWLVENGADFVKQKRQEWQKIFDEVKPDLDAAEAAEQEHHELWRIHAEDCIAKGLDKDSHDKEKYQVNMFGKDK